MNKRDRNKNSIQECIKAIVVMCILKPLLDLINYLTKPELSLFSIRYYPYTNHYTIIGKEIQFYHSDWFNINHTKEGVLFS